MKQRIRLLGFILPLSASLLLASGKPEPKQAQLAVIIDSLSGVVEVQRAGGQVWEKAEKGIRLGNNDLVRSTARSTARLVWPDGARAYVRESTQILINLHRETRGSGLLSRHTTIFFGAVLFVIEAVLPSPQTRTDTKVFTPTAIVAIRGTSFLVTVDETSGRTEVDVLKGTVLVKNIIRDISTYVTAGYRTLVLMGKDPQRPDPISAAMIRDLRKWVPPPVVAGFPEAQTLLAGLDSIQSRRVVVSAFTVPLRYEGPRDVGAGFSSALKKAISSADTSLTVIAADGWTDPMTLGVRQRARFVLTGEILAFDISQRARIVTGEEKHTEYAQISVVVRISVADLLESRQRMERVFYAEHTDAAEQAFWTSVKTTRLNPDDPDFASSLVGRAVMTIVQDALRGILEVLVK